MSLSVNFFNVRIFGKVRSQNGGSLVHFLRLRGQAHEVP